MVQNIRFDFKESYKIADLQRIMEILRSENGCPWDREQDHKSIRLNILEEAYEVADAIDNADDAALCEELGDVLLQIVFHARMAEEDGRFDFDAVADGICKKLILRHPHVFGDTKVNGTEQVLDNWDKIKQVEKHQSTATDTLKSVPNAFPALLRAQKVQKRAAKVGFDWRDVDGALAKIPEEAQEVREAIAAGDADHIAEELGDLLFAVVNTARFAGVDAEDALQRATNKFINRFAKTEQLAIARGIDMPSTPIEELDKLWDEVKSQEK